MAREVAWDDIATVFSTVADDTRLQILNALWTADRSGEAPLQFSQLREEAGISDSGRFNYHLDELVPEFVRKQDGRYDLTLAAKHLIGDAVSGSYRTGSDVTIHPTGVRDCPDPDCAGTVEARYETGRAVFECDTCETPPDVVPVPPVLIDGDDVTETFRRAGRYTLLTMERFARGFCPLCDGTVEQSIAAVDPAFEPILGTDIEVVHLCQACGHRRTSGAVALLIGHPAVVSLLHETGIDYRDTPYWEQDWLLESEETLASREPPRVRVETTIDDYSVTVTLDGRLDVLECEFGEPSSATSGDTPP